MASEFREYTSPVAASNPRVVPATGGVAALTNGGIGGSQSLVANPSGALKGLTAGGAVTFTEFNNTIDIVVPNPLAIEPRFNVYRPVTIVLAAGALNNLPNSGAMTFQNQAGVALDGTYIRTNQAGTRLCKWAVTLSVESSAAQEVALRASPRLEFNNIGTEVTQYADLAAGERTTFHFEQIVSVTSGNRITWRFDNDGPSNISLINLMFTLYPIDSV